MLFARRMSLKDSANFCRRVGTGFKAGVDFLRLIDAESRYGSNRQRGVMADVGASLRQGEQLNVAMRKHVDFFPPLMIAMTNAGEVTGTLDRTLIAMADYYEERVKLYREFISRITWPLLQLFAAINILALLIYILGILGSSTGGQLNDFTGLGLRGGSGVLKLYGFVFLAGSMLAAIIIGFRKNLVGVQNLIPVLYKLPVAGEALQTITLARFAWTLALSQEAGIGPIKAIHLSLDATDSQYYQSAKDDIEQSIHEGKSISETLHQTGVFPEEFITEIGVAEMSGTDAESMQHLAKQYDVRARSAMRTLAGIASGLIATSVVIGIVALIIRMLMNIGSMYQEALQPI